MDQMILSKKAIDLIHDWEAPKDDETYVKFIDIGDEMFTIGSGIAFTKDDATVQEIEKELDQLKDIKEKKEYLYGYFLQTIVRITNGIIEIYNKKVDSIKEQFPEINIKYPTFDSLPQGGKECLILLAYNVGPEKVRLQYHKLVTNLCGGDFYGAVSENGRTSKNPKFQKGLLNRTIHEQEYLRDTYDENGNYKQQQI